jgi:hypothetical protein
MPESGTAIIILNEEIMIGLWKARPKMHTVERNDVQVYAVGKGLRGHWAHICQGYQSRGSQWFSPRDSINNRHLDILRHN